MYVSEVDGDHALVIPLDGKVLKIFEEIEAGSFDDAAPMTIKRLREELFLHCLASKTEALIEGLEDEKEIALTLAQWVAATHRNYSINKGVYNVHWSGDLAALYFLRLGPCGARTRIFAHMAETAGLDVRLFSIYNFGHVGGGHTCAQVRINGEWAFIDVTYAGYFEKDGRILPYEEIFLDRENALKYLRPFKGQKSKTGYVRFMDWGKTICNTSSMRYSYSPEKLGFSRAFGFVPQQDKPIWLDYTIAPGLRLGEKGSVERDAVRKRISEQLGNLGFISNNFFHNITLTDLKPETTYTIKYEFNAVRLDPEDTFTLEPVGFKFKHKKLFKPIDFRKKDWVLQFEISEGDEAKFKITHTCGYKRGLTVKSITFTEEPAADAGHTLAQAESIES